MVLRRGTGGYLTNGIVARWQRQGLSVRDAETDALHRRSDSLNVVNLLLAENTANYDADAGSDFGEAAAFAAANHVADAGHRGLALHQPHPGSLDWTPPGGSPAAAGAGTVVIPAEYTGAATSAAR